MAKILIFIFIGIVLVGLSFVATRASRGASEPKATHLEFLAIQARCLGAYLICVQFIAILSQISGHPKAADIAGACAWILSLAYSCVLIRALIWLTDEVASVINRNRCGCDK